MAQIEDHVNGGHTKLSMLLPMSGSKLSSISSETVMAAAAAKALRRLCADEDPPIESLMAEIRALR